MIDICLKFYKVPSAPCPILDLKGQGRGLKIFMLKFLGPYYFQTLWWIWFMFCMMIGKGPSCNITTPVHDLKAKVTDLEFLC